MLCYIYIHTYIYIYICICIYIYIYIYVYVYEIFVFELALLIVILCVWCKMEFGNEYGSEHILEWVMQLFVLNTVMIVDEMWFKLCAGCVVDNYGSPDVGETLTK